MAVWAGYDKISLMGASVRPLYMFCVVGILIAVLFGLFPRATAGTNENLSGWAWSSNIGWISFNSNNDHDSVTPGIQAAASNYGVTADATGKLSGYAWSSNIGWISFNRTSGCPGTADNPSCTPTVNQIDWQLRGWAQACAGRVNAQACSGSDRMDGWDGWISLFGGTTHTVQINGCSYSGYAWGGPIVGWISFSSINDHDAVTPGIQAATSPYGVFGNGLACETADPVFECNDGIDNDGDGTCDFGGCLIGTTNLSADVGCLSTFDNTENQAPTIVRLGPGTINLNIGDVFSDPGVIATDPEDGDITGNVVVGGDIVNTSALGTYIISYAVTDSGGVAALSVQRTVIVGIPLGPECNNGFDDDGDGGCDYNGCSIGGIDLPPDLGCASANSLIEDPECSNGIDDDNDRLTDNQDPGCWADPKDPNTYNPAHGRERRIRIIEVLPE
jgi:hypothetical protein